MMKDERGSAGVYILSMIFMTCIIMMACYFAIAEQAGNVRSYARTQIEQAGIYVLEQSVEYDTVSNKYVIGWTQNQLQTAFQSRIQLNHYSVNKFQVLDKGATDPQGYHMAQPGLYIELSLPIAGFNIPVGEDVVTPPYNAETKTWVQ